LSIETLRDSHVFVVEMREALAADEDSEWFSVQLGVEESVERVVHLNIALAERLAALRLPAAIGNHTSFTYVPAA
jgi:hypothetical protein